MARTHKKVRYSPPSKQDGHTPATAAGGVEQAFKFLEGRWKLVILFHLFGGTMLRFSDLERAIPAISQKMLIQQLRQMEKDGIVRRIVHHQVPPKVSCISRTTKLVPGILVRRCQALPMPEMPAPTMSTSKCSDACDADAKVLRAPSTFILSLPWEVTK